jgi:hypothetical protein
MRRHSAKVIETRDSACFCDDGSAARDPLA